MGRNNFADVLMTSDDEDLPISYLFYVIALITLIGLFFVGGYLLLYG
jgi:hypothetical protein